MKKRFTFTTIQLSIVLIILLVVASWFYFQKPVTLMQNQQSNSPNPTSLNNPTDLSNPNPQTIKPTITTSAQWVWTKRNCGSQAGCIYDVCSNADNNNCIKCTSKNNYEPKSNENPYTSSNFTCQPRSPVL